MKVEVDVLGSPFLIQVIFLMVSVDVKLRLKKLRGCVKVEVNVLGSPFLRVLMVSVDVKQHLTH